MYERGAFSQENASVPFTVAPGHVSGRPDAGRPGPDREDDYSAGGSGFIDSSAEALAAADAGNYRDAAARLARQADALDAQYQYAAPAVQVQIRQESENLRQRSTQLQQGQYDSATRKSMQWESFNSRNQKSYAQ